MVIRLLKTLALGTLFLTLTSSEARAEFFVGSDGVSIDFPKGVISFADRLVVYDPLFSGGPAPSGPDAFNDPLQALGPTNFTEPGGPEMVSLGNGGRLILEFTDNFLTGSGDNSPDLAIFEIGLEERTLVDISQDGFTWFSVGTAAGGTKTINIDAFGFGPAYQFKFVRLTDDPNEGPGDASNLVGADIDAVGAITTQAVPEPSSLALFGLGSLGILGFRLWRSRAFLPRHSQAGQITRNREC